MPVKMPHIMQRCCNFKNAFNLHEDFVLLSTKWWCYFSIWNNHTYLQCTHNTNRNFKLTNKILCQSLAQSSYLFLLSILCKLLDINECDLVPCEQKCVNTIGSYFCGCAPGYSLNSNLRSCDGRLSRYWTCHTFSYLFSQDIDECRNAILIGDKLCPSEMTCVNTRGSFYCQCSTGYINNNGTCKSKNFSVKQ